jgi:uncharacterized protein
MAEKNSIGWFEIHVKNFDDACKFYGGIFNWEFKLPQGADSPYCNILTGEGSIGGGFTKKSKPEHDGQSVIIYIEVTNIDETLKKASAIGGKVHTPKTLISETAGSFGLFNDPDNNLIGLWSKN